MPFRIRKSFKIAPGLRINLGKSGLSASFGSGAFRYVTPKAGGGCFYYLFIYPFVFIFGFYYLLFYGLWWLIKKAWNFSTATPQRKKISALAILVLTIACVCYNLSIITLEKAGFVSTSTPRPISTPWPTATEYVSPFDKTATARALSPAPPASTPSP